MDLFAQAQAADQEEEEAPEKEEAGENEEPEDDFEAAWDILDLARTTYDTMQGDESQLKLAATYMALGDISLETGKSLMFSGAGFIDSQFQRNSIRQSSITSLHWTSNPNYSPYRIAKLLKHISVFHSLMT